MCPFIAFSNTMHCSLMAYRYSICYIVYSALFTVVDVL